MTQSSASNPNRLGTFLGVYTPTILTILGVIMYIRSGWLVGHLGLTRSLLVIALANTITLITTLSFSSVATNERVGVGGAYYIVSRSLGVSWGGSLGLPLFFSQALSVTLYAYGLAESLRIVWPAIPIPAAAAVIIGGVALLAIPGARLALRTQVPLMVLIGISLAAFAVGAKMRGAGPIEVHLPSGELTFWAGFAVFFPAVTGVMAGLALSGDLRDPIRAIPRGSILAVLTGFAVYLALPFLLIRVASAVELRNDPMIWTRIAVLGPWLVLPGLWGAIFSSAVGSMLAAPRTLQALSMDRLLPRFLGRQTGHWRDLLPGFAITLALALSAVALGDLNAVARVVAMFFLTVYGTLNIVAAAETLGGDPSWRPRLRVPWPISLVGGLACLGTMFLIHPIAGGAAILAESGLWIALSRRHHAETWGDARRGIYESIIRWALIRLARRPVSARNWRPHILVFTSDLEQRLQLVRFGTWFSQNRGIVSVCRLVVGDLLDERMHPAARQREMQAVLEREHLMAFAEVAVVDEELTGITEMTQAHGVGVLESNTVLVGWPNSRVRLIELLRIMRRLENLERSFVIGRLNVPPPEGEIRGEVHVWWGGLQRNGDLMLMLAYLLTRNQEWRRAKVRVMSIASNEEMKAETEGNLERLLQEIRVEAGVRVMVKPKDRTVREMIQEESASAEAVFLGLATPSSEGSEGYAARMEELAGELRRVFFVKNSSCFVGELMVSAEEASSSGET